MISGLNEINAIMADHIDQAVFLGDAPGPDIRAEELEGFGLTDALKRVTHDRFDQLENPKSCFPVGFHPVFQILPEFRLENRLSPGANPGRFP